MGMPSTHVMPEYWTQLNTANTQKTLCGEEIEALKAACKKDCGKDNVGDCHECYVKVLDRLRGRFQEREEREWFSERQAFLSELEGLFQEAKDRKRSVKSIEARIESEKEAWYRWVLRRYPEFIAVAERGMQDRLKDMLGDPDTSRDELVEKVLEGIGKPKDWPSSVDSLTERVAASKGDAAELKKLYMAEFFVKTPTGEVLDNAQSYLDEYQNNNTMSLEDVIDKLVQDVQHSRKAQPQRENHQKRLAELQRAKAAVEQNKAQAKSQRLQSGTAGEDLYGLPPCSMCHKIVSPGSVLSCSVCQALKQAGGAGSLTVYCSDECYTKGHDSHIDVKHDCESGDKCVQLRDEDIEMSDGTPTAVCCGDCLDQKQATLFCSERCAVANVAEHRQSKHDLKTGTDEAASAVKPLKTFVDSTLEAKNPGLKMERVA